MKYENDEVISTTQDGDEVTRGRATEEILAFLQEFKEATNEYVQIVQDQVTKDGGLSGIQAGMMFEVIHDGVHALRNNIGILAQHELKKTVTDLMSKGLFPGVPAMGQPQSPLNPDDFTIPDAFDPKDWGISE